MFKNILVHALLAGFLSLYAMENEACRVGEVLRREGIVIIQNMKGHIPSRAYLYLLRSILKDIEKGEAGGVRSWYQNFKQAIIVLHKNELNMRLWLLSGDRCPYLKEMYPVLEKLFETKGFSSGECKKKLVELAEQVVKEGADVNCAFINDEFDLLITPLGLAASLAESMGSSDMVEMLLKRGADKDLHTPLIWAIEYESIAGVERLLRAGADVNAQLGGVSGLYRLLTHKNTSHSVEKILKTMLAQPEIDVNIRNENDGNVPLCATEVPWVTKALLDSGADPTITDNNGQRVYDVVKPKLEAKLSDSSWYTPIFKEALEKLDQSYTKHAQIQ